MLKRQINSVKKESKLTFFLNDEFVFEDDLFISPLDRGFQFGDGVFETIKAVNSVPFRLPQHYERMISTAKFLDIIEVLSLEKVANIISELIKRNDLINAQIRLTISSGKEGSSSPTFLVSAKPFKPYPEKLYQDGAIIINSKYRKCELTPAARIKTTSYEENLILRREAKSLDCLESVVCNHDNFICEGSFSNVFAIIDGKVVTPDDDLPILPGVTRQTVIEICKENAIEVMEDRFFLEDFLSAEEVFLSSTLMDIMPVIKVLTYPEHDRTSGSALKINVIGTGKPGPITTKLMKLFEQKINVECGHKK